MSSLTISEIKNGDQIKASLDAGEIVELREGNKVIGRILPEATVFVPQSGKWLDFGAETRAIFGDRILPGADLLIEERENSRF
jgi:hypothetical protein